MFFINNALTCKYQTGCLKVEVSLHKSSISQPLMLGQLCLIVLGNMCMCVAVCSCGSDFVVAEMSVRIH